MNENTKKSWIAGLGIAGAAIAALIALATQCVRDEPPTPEPTPTVSPTPTPEPTVTASPTATPTATPTVVPVGRVRGTTTYAAKPYPGKTLLYTERLTYAALKGETFGLLLDVTPGACVSVPAPADGFKFQAYAMPKVRTTVASHNEAQPGEYYDPLVPSSQLCAGPQWLDVSVPKTAAAGLYTFQLHGLELKLTVANAVLPDQLSTPMYAELQSAQLLRAHGLTDNVQTQGAITRKYVAFLRQHRIEPVKQNITTYPTTNFDNWGELGGSFRQIVLDGAIAPPCIFGPAPDLTPSTVLLQTIQAKLTSGEIPSDSWVYAWDEGEFNANVTAAAVARVKLIKASAPSLKVMITRQEDPNFLSWVDTFYPVMDWFKVPGRVQIYTKPYGLYTSCMANGNCSNAVGPQRPSGTPMMVLDSESVHQRAFAWVGYKLGASGLLYFNTTQRLPQAWTDQRNEGGNGDGTLLYPGAGGEKGPAGEPVASIRLKQIRDGMNDLEVIAAAKRKGIDVTAKLQALVPDQFRWSRKYEDYVSARRALIEGTGL